MKTDRQNARVAFRLSTQWLRERRADNVESDREAIAIENEQAEAQRVQAERSAPYRTPCGRIRTSEV